MYKEKVNVLAGAMVDQKKGTTAKEEVVRTLI